MKAKYAPGCRLVFEDDTRNAQEWIIICARKVFINRRLAFCLLSFIIVITLRRLLLKLRVLRRTRKPIVYEAYVHLQESKTGFLCVAIPPTYSGSNKNKLQEQRRYAKLKITRLLLPENHLLNN